MSGEERTHHWLMSNMGSDLCERENDPNFEIRDPLSSHGQSEESTPIYNPHGSGNQPTTIYNSPDDEIPSPVDSVELERNSNYSMDDEDAGPPSVETQPPDNPEDIEVSPITSTWINSGGVFATEGSIHYREVGEDPPSLMQQTSIMDQRLIEEMPSLTPEINSQKTFIGPLLPNAPFSSPTNEVCPVVYGDIPDESASSGICGLHNLGNTCFMSAGIQCLVNTPPIAQYFFDNQEKDQDVRGNLAGCFSELIHKIWSGKYSSIRPSDFKDAFGQQWRDFSDYRQHDCQEFVTLLFEALRKQMPILESEGHSSYLAPSDKTPSTTSVSHPSCSSSSRSSISSRSSCPVGGSRESRSSASPSPPPSPFSPGSLKATFEPKPDLEDTIGLDSGPASPKSSISSSSVDTHLISLRLQPIPEEVKDPCSKPKLNLSLDDLASRSQDAESVASDMSDSGDIINVESCGMDISAGVMAVRQYNQLAATENCDNNSFDCDTSSRDIIHKSGDRSEQFSSSELNTNTPNHCLLPSTCDSSFTSMNINNKEKVSSQINVNSCIESEPFSNNRSHLSLVKIEDILKESKTSNVNVLGKDSMSNNKLLFDSEKYAKSDSKKIKNSVDNLTRAGIKRVKEVNLLVDKMDNSYLDATSDRVAKGLSTNLAMHKKMRLEEKNVQYELEKNQGGDFYEGISSEVASTSSAPAAPELKGQRSSTSISPIEVSLAEQSWKSFLRDGKSAIVDSFYGQFRSSVVCSVCGHTSIKFDPFGTLSVPLPHANEIQIPTIFVPTGDCAPTRCLITLCKIGTIKDLKQAIAELLNLQNENELVIAEVFDNHIARTVDDGFQARYLNYTNRSIYAFQLVSPPPCFDDDIGDMPILTKQSDFDSLAEHQYMQTSSEDVTDARAFAMPDLTESCSVRKKDSYVCSKIPLPEANRPSSFPDTASWQQCNICLEEICQTDLKTHENCEDCLLCEDCIEMSCKHHGGGSVPCPVCHTRLSPNDLIPVAKRKVDKPKARILRVSVVFRLDTESTDNNKREMQLIGHPCLLSLPSRIKSRTLFKLLEKKLLPDTCFTLHLVEGRGYNCSRCLFSSHCRGCEAISGAEVILQASDTLCIKFTSISSEQFTLLSRVEDHSSLLAVRQNAPLTLYDCLRAFSQSETLKESESWFCPNCQKKQQATKTIAVWHYPPYLVIHLERFLFHGTVSTKVDDKVIFPLDGLELTDFVAGDQSESLLYNLYGCVCHMGVAQAGHYTALVRSPVTGEWHYFNDDSVMRQKPREEEYSTAYLLFYHRQGTNFNISLPLGLTSPKLPPKWDQQPVETEADSGHNQTVPMEDWSPSAVDNSVIFGQELSEDEISFSNKKLHNTIMESDQNLFNISQGGEDGMQSPDVFYSDSHEWHEVPNVEESQRRKNSRQKDSCNFGPLLDE